MSNHLVELEKCGQSVWLDNISREILLNGILKNHIEKDGLKGVTSNPSIFQKAMGSGTYYDDQIKTILSDNPFITTDNLFEQLALKDIQDAADTLLTVYKSTSGFDGYVSLEVSPALAYDTKGTIEAARRLFKKAGRPNVMIKIPATIEGIPAIKQMISEGVNINVTLIFSQAVYEDVVEAYISGLEKRLSEGLEINNIASVASFFISRIDSAVDKELDNLKHTPLKGKVAIANAKVVYQKAKVLFGSERFSELKKHGASIQRLLWASTGTKNPAYPDTLYVDELVGENTVNTMPPATMDAFRDHGSPEIRIENDVEQAQSDMNLLKEIGINFSGITDKLTSDGVILFLDAYNELISTLDQKKKKILNEMDAPVKYFLDDETAASVNERLQNWTAQNFSKKFWNKDHKLWKEDKKDDVELSDRLGWLNLPVVMKEKIQMLHEFAGEIKNDFKNVIVLGMGGSSLAPEVFYKVLGNQKGYPELKVIDSTHPDAVNKIIQTFDIAKSLFVVSSKSGGTTETMSFLHTFYEVVSKYKENPGENFIAVTDAGTSLDKLASLKKFKKVFNTPEEVGGRYSALTFFGLVPAALIGVDIDLLLNRAEEMMNKCMEIIPADQNPGFIAGAVIGEYALKGVDKITFIASKGISSLPVWIEQLIAESTGKEGKGILPVVDEKQGDTEVYGRDRLFVYLKLNEDQSPKTDEAVNNLIEAGFPVIRIILEDKYDIAKEFYRWEIATAAAGSVMKINPFNQPNVQLAKELASEAMKKFSETGKLPEQEILFEQNGIAISGNIESRTTTDAFKEFFSKADNDSYAAVMAFIPPSDYAEKALNELKLKIRNKYKIAVTSGYGPRFLHSTGQLHKGDGNKGLFIQIISKIYYDVNVPGTNYSFGTLITAQAGGDLKALENSGRKTLQVILSGSIPDQIKKLASMI
jgi:transaldolase / glucose-6-phosphate isomerase